MRATHWAMSAGLCLALLTAGCGAKKKESGNTNNCLTADACCVLAREAGDENNTKGADDCVGADLGGDKWCDDAATLAKNALNADEKDGECILKLKPMVSTRVPILWVTSTGENKVAQFDSTTGEEVLRVPTWGRYPNRTAVAADGSVWITNRDSYQYIRIGLDGEPVCASNYGTSGSLVDNDIVGYTRAAAIDSEGNAWIGFHDTGIIVKVSSTETDGMVTLTDPNDGVTTKEVPRCKELKRLALVTTRPYGFAIDGDGFLWTGILQSGTVAKVDTKKEEIVGEYDLTMDPKYAAAVADGGLGNCFSVYGMTLDFDGNPWYANFYCGTTVVKLDKETGKIALVATSPLADDPKLDGAMVLTGPRSAGVDTQGHIWVADQTLPYIHEFLSDGTWVKAVEAKCPDNDTDLSTMLGIGSDIDGNMWSPAYGSGRVFKFKTDGTVVGCYPEGDGTDPTKPYLVTPYTYSDLTGSSNALVTSQLGKWRAIVEQETAVQWALVSYKAKTPEGTKVCIRVRGADTKATLKTEPWSDSLCEGKDVLGYTVHTLNAKGMKVVGKTKLLEVELQLASSKKDADPPQVSDLSVGALTTK